MSGAIEVAEEGASVIDGPPLRTLSDHIGLRARLS